jgi:hypothetical protein
MAEDGGVGRVRRGLVPLDTGRVVVSDLLLFAPSKGGSVETRNASARSPLPQNRAEAAALMLESESIASAGRIGVYWETYGLAPDEEFEVSVQVNGAAPGVARRILRAVGIGETPARAGLAWTEVATGAAHPRAIVLDVSGLGQGEYSLAIGVETRRGHSAASARTFRVDERRNDGS